MFKGVTFIINIFLLILFNIASNDVSVNQTTPKRVETGNSFIVNVEINKGNTNGYAKYQVILPQGVTAEEIESGDAKFTVDGNKVKFVWVTLPEVANLNLSYKVIVKESEVKEVALGGTFAFLKDNERQTVEAPINRIAIGEKVVEIAKVETPVVQLNRIITPISDNKFKVTIHLNTQHVKGFAKIQDEIPAGSKASIDVVEDAVFTPIASKVKFVWMNFPEDKNSLSVSYFIETTDNDTPEINGVFAYLSDGQTLKSAIELQNDALAISDTKLENSTNSANSYALETTSQNETKPNTESVKQTAKPKETPKTTKNSQPKRRPKTTSAAGQVTPIPISSEPEEGIVYKVQLMAGHNNVANGNYFSSKYGFKRKVVMDLHEGWHKYVTGNSSTYKQARDLRNEIRSNFSFRGPFVVAYNKGERITVQEALMATHQKWVP